MRKAKLLRIRRILSRINDPLLKLADLPGIDMTKTVDHAAVIRSIKGPNQTRLAVLKHIRRNECQKNMNV